MHSQIALIMLMEAFSTQELTLQAFFALMVSKATIFHVKNVLSIC